jgi:hypothetical protein
MNDLLMLIAMIITSVGAAALVLVLSKAVIITLHHYITGDSDAGCHKKQRVISPMPTTIKRPEQSRIMPILLIRGITIRLSKRH